MDSIPKINLNIDGTFLGNNPKGLDNNPKNSSVSALSEREEGNLTPKTDSDDILRATIHQKFEKIKNPKKSTHKTLKLLIFSVVIILGLISFFVLSGYQFYKQIVQTKDAAMHLSELISGKNLDEVGAGIDNLESELNRLNKKYRMFYILKPVPFIGNYIDDGNSVLMASADGIDLARILIKTSEPYADFLGYYSSKVVVKNGSETAKDKIDFVIKTIPELLKQVDEINSKIASIKDNLNQIDPYKYPEKIGDNIVRENIVRALEFINTGSEFVINGKPLLENSQELLGVNEPKTYLVLFQNDKELRPTGGFITAYSIARVTKGRFEPVVSDDIYNLDDKYTPSVTAPDPLIKYIKGPYVLSRKYKLRDMNWSPDFSNSMELFSKEAEKAGIKNIDGIISVDTQLLVNLLNVLGEVPVAGYGNFSTKIVKECNCPQVIYELESFADVEGPIVWSENTGEIVYAPPNYDNRKKIIGPLMNAILSSTLGLPNEKFPQLFEAVVKSVNEKHALLYMRDDNLQKAIESFNLAGKVKDYNGDYLYVNDANLGGRKSNLYITQEIDQKIDIKKDGVVEKTVTITYKNPQKNDGWLNSVLPNWIRIYVPAGSRLIDFQGVEDKAAPYEDLGKTVFAGFYKLRPEGVIVVTVKYEIPQTFDKQFNLLIQKQPGTDKPMHTISVGNWEDEFYLTSDKEVKIKL